MKGTDIARIAAQAQGGQVLVSGTVRDLVAGSGAPFVAEGARSLKGISDEVRRFSLSRTRWAEVIASEYEDVLREWLMTFRPMIRATLAGTLDRYCHAVWRS